MADIHEPLDKPVSLVQGEIFFDHSYKNKKKECNHKNIIEGFTGPLGYERIDSPETKVEGSTDGWKKALDQANDAIRYLKGELKKKSAPPTTTTTTPPPTPPPPPPTPTTPEVSPTPEASPPEVSPPVPEVSPPPPPPPVTAPVILDCDYGQPNNAKYLAGYPNASSVFATPDAAFAACNTTANCGGITYRPEKQDANKWEMRSGSTLKPSTTNEVSWVKSSSNKADCDMSKVISNAQSSSATTLAASEKAAKTCKSGVIENKLSEFLSKDGSVLYTRLTKTVNSKSTLELAWSYCPENCKTPRCVKGGDPRDPQLIEGKCPSYCWRPGGKHAIAYCLRWEDRFAAPAALSQGDDCRGCDVTPLQITQKSISKTQLTKYDSLAASNDLCTLMVPGTSPDNNSMYYIFANTSNNTLFAQKDFNKTTTDTSAIFKLIKQSGDNKFAIKVLNKYLTVKTDGKISFSSTIGAQETFTIKGAATNFPSGGLALNANNLCDSKCVNDYCVEGFTSGENSNNQLIYAENDNQKHNEKHFCLLSLLSAFIMLYFVYSVYNGKLTFDIATVGNKQNHVAILAICIVIIIVINNVI